MWNFLGYLRNTFSNIGLPRSGSLTIPTRPQQDHTTKRPRSIGSKPPPNLQATVRKSQGLKGNTSKKQIIVNHSHHSHLSIQKHKPSALFDEVRHQETEDFSAESQQGSKNPSSSIVDLLSGLDESSNCIVKENRNILAQEEQIDLVEPRPEKSHSRRKNKVKGRSVYKGQSRLIQQSSMRIVRRIRERCPLCRLPMTEEDYLQLACTHRFHRGCAYKMQERNCYTCSLCEVLRYKFGSILLLKGRRGCRPPQESE